MEYQVQKEWSTDACYDLGGPWRHYVWWNKPETEEQILFDSTYLRYPEQTNS